MGKTTELVKDLFKSGSKENKATSNEIVLSRDRDTPNNTVQFAVSNKKGTKFMYSGPDSCVSTDRAFKLANQVLQQGNQ
jgi:hypothetical protein